MTFLNLHPQKNREGAVIVAFRFVAILLVLSFGVIVGYGVESGGTQESLPILLLAGASLFGGVFLGLLFGVPRYLSTPTSTSAGGSPPKDSDSMQGEYKPNTNLEEISDWLTKILVGAGLTQLGSGGKILKGIGSFIAEGVKEPKLPVAQIAATEVVLFSLAGFFVGYLWSRIYLPGALSDAEREALKSEIENERNEQEALDAEAITLVTKIINNSGDQNLKQYVDRFKELLPKISIVARATIFSHVRFIRTTTWRDDKQLMQRTIPIFRAFVDNLDMPRKHEYFGELGFALKDKEKPEYEEAKKYIGMAITTRGDEEYAYYELVRAQCNILLDDNFAIKKPSSEELREIIWSDLRIVHRELPDIKNNDIERWEALNSDPKNASSDRP